MYNDSSIIITFECLIRKEWHVSSTSVCFFLPISIRDLNMAVAASSSLSAAADTRASRMPDKRKNRETNL